MHLTEETLDRWIEKHLVRLSTARRQKVEEYLQDMKLKGYSPWTRIAALKAIMLLGSDGKPYEQFDERDLVAWLDALASKGLRPESLNSFKKRVRAFLRWVYGIQRGQPSPPFLKVLRDTRLQRTLPKEILTAEEVSEANRFLRVFEELGIGARSLRIRGEGR
jgi:site-specific recombinase XerD